MKTRRYPNIQIRSKNELAKHISSKRLSRQQALSLINDVLKNYDSYWKDSVHLSESDKDKYVRNAKGTPLGRLLELINKKVLKPHDNLLPDFIYGGVEGRSHVSGAKNLLGKKKKRTLLALDIKGFFEKIEEKRVEQFFKIKCNCRGKGASLLAHLCCVPIGPKGAENFKTLGRGFSTSSRLSIWCNLDIFIKLERLVQKKLKGKDPRITIFVDDIGVTASQVSKDEMMSLAGEIIDLLHSSDPNQKLPVNKDKTRVVSYTEDMEHLGLKLLRNGLTVSNKIRNRDSATLFL